MLPKKKIPQHLAVPYDLSHHLYGNTQRLREELGYQEHVSFDDGMKFTVAWEREHPPERVDPNRFDYAAEDAALA